MELANEGAQRIRALAYADGYAAAEADWSNATGHKDLKAAKKAAKGSAVKYPGRWVDTEHGRQFVRGYSNGRFGYYTADGLFVDLPAPDGYFEEPGRTPQAPKLRAKVAKGQRLGYST